MLYRLEDGSVKKPNPAILKSLSSALNLNYEDLLKKAGYLTNIVSEKNSVGLEESDVYDLEYFLKSEYKIVKKKAFVKSKDIDDYLMCQTNYFLPFFGKNMYLGVSGVSVIQDKGLYIRYKNSSVQLLIGKNNEVSQGSCFFIYPNLVKPYSVACFDEEIFKVECILTSDDL